MWARVYFREAKNPDSEKCDQLRGGVSLYTPFRWPEKDDRTNERSTSEYRRVKEFLFDLRKLSKPF
jgi:hypothetical protein